MPKRNKPLIAVTGGIGSGKSVVCRILRTLGYSVLDTDSEAKAIMDADRDIHARLNSEIAAEIVRDGVIDRRRLAEIVFADAEKLAILNSIVHAAVRHRIEEWAQTAPSSPAFVETALLFQSGLNEMVDAELRITAPEEIRIRRVMERNNLTRDKIEARIASQAYIPAPNATIPPLTEVKNDEITPVLPQVERFLNLTISDS